MDNHMMRIVYRMLMTKDEKRSDRLCVQMVNGMLMTMFDEMLQNGKGEPALIASE